MSQLDDLKFAMRHMAEPSKREIRAARTRAQALSPWRIFKSLLSLPIVTIAVTVSLYVRTSDYDPPDALAHLVARTGCDAAWAIGLAPSYRGQLGYHARNDPDGDGVACDGARIGQGRTIQSAILDATAPQTNPVADPVPDPTPGLSNRMVNGAKFIRP